MGKEHEDGSRSYFNTSHVSINLSLYPIHVYVHHDFNTSHVSINLYSPSFTIDCEIISIHLMFLLIQACFSHQPVARHFNTSHVSINQPEQLGEWICANISIHLMFLLIGMIPCKILERCHISIHLMFLLISQHWKT